MFSDTNRNGGSTPIIGVIPLRIGAGATLLYMHAWQEAVSAWQHLWNQAPWGSIATLTTAGLPLPQVLATVAAAVAAFTAVSWILGFATRFAAFIFLPVALGALLVSNRTGQSIAAEACVLYFLAAVTLLVSGSGWLAVDTLFSLGKGAKTKKSGYH